VTAPASSATEHAVARIATARGANGRRTIFYGYCTCGAGTTSSANSASVERKLNAHARGDDRGIYKEGRR
jgi:hypothetical protein